MTNSTFDRIHIKVFEEILCGRFRPDNERFSNMDEPLNLVNEANTFKIAILQPEQNILEYIERSDFSAFGFKDSRDYELETKELNSGRTEIFIKPARIYELKEAMDIPLFSTIKNSCFLQLICDQFERVKIRAEHALESEPDDKAIRSYANRHIQKAKKLFYDGKVLLRELQHRQDPENIYIIFILNIFLIRIILFYQKMFRPYINLEKSDSEEQLKLELNACLSMSRIAHIFRLTDTGYCSFLKKSKPENTDVSIQERSEAYANPAKTFCVKHQSHDNSGLLKGGAVASDNESAKTFSEPTEKPVGKEKTGYSKLQWNGQINVLVDMFLQCMEEQWDSGSPLLETSYQDLKNFLLANFCDKKGNDLSYHTITTLLDPRRFDKRLHPESPKRIKIGKNPKR